MVHIEYFGTICAESGIMTQKERYCFGNILFVYLCYTGKTTNCRYQADYRKMAFLIICCEVLDLENVYVFLLFHKNDRCWLLFCKPDRSTGHIPENETKSSTQARLKNDMKTSEHFYKLDPSNTE